MWSFALTFADGFAVNPRERAPTSASYSTPSFRRIVSIRCHRYHHRRCSCFHLDQPLTCEKMSEAAAPRRSARNASKPAPAPAAPAAPKKAATTKRKSTTEADAETENNGAAAEESDAKPTKPAKAAKAAAEPKAGQLKVGDKLPGFKLKLEDGEEIDTADLKNAVLFRYVPSSRTPHSARVCKNDEAAKNASTEHIPTILSFLLSSHSYPRANTSGCTTQAKLFRDHHSSFTDSSYTVYGLSNDSPTSLSTWKQKQSFPYNLISDPNRKLIKSLTGSDDKTRRSHFVIDDQGRLAFVELSVKPVESWESALKFVEEQKNKK